MHEGNPVLNILIRGQCCINGSSIYICLMCLVSPVVISSNKTNVSFREIAHFIARNSFTSLKNLISKTDFTAIKYSGQGSFKVKKWTIDKLLFLLKTIGIFP